MSASLLGVLGVASLPISGDLTTSQAGDGYGGSTSGIAEREMIRRQQNIAEADAAVAEGDKLSAEGNYEQAIAEYRRALDLYPVAPITESRRQTATAMFADASINLARQRAEGGDYAAARGLLQQVLSPDVDPDNKKAQALLEDLDDPEIWNPANSPEHTADVQEVEKFLNLAVGQYDLGQFDEAKKSLNSVLSVDRYNVAARQMLEKIDRYLSNTYYQSARDQTRAAMLRQVDELWETAVVSDAVDTGDINGLPIPIGGEEITNDKLRTIRIPSVQFDDATVQEAVDFLRIKSKEMDINTANPEEKGVNILIKEDQGGSLGADGAGGGSIASRRITLSLTDVPLGEALKYVTDLASLRFRVEPFAVVVVPATDTSNEFYTRVFRVPPTFLSAGGSDDGAAAAADPFATDAAPTGMQQRKTALEVLSAAGVTFPDGASAFYNPATSQLIVRNTANNVDLIAQFVEQIVRAGGQQVFITTKFVEVTQTNTEELGFDWLLGGFNVPGSDRSFAQGGTVGNASAGPVSTNDFNFVAPGSDVPIGSFPVSRGLRFGGDAISNNAIDGLINAGAEVVSSSSPGIFALAGVFTDPQFQVVVRALSQKKGVDLMSAPSVVTKSGQRAKIEVIREFIYPIEFDPPEIPQNFGSSNLSGSFNPFTGASSGGVSSFPVTPTTPTAFETRNTGVTLEVDPVVGPDGYTIDLNLAPEVVEFEGFINYGSPIQSGATNALGLATTVVLTENRIEQPIFSTRKAQTSVTIYDGATVAIGGLIREDIQSVEDKVPFLGDIPFIGRLFRTDAENHFKRNLVIFVSAKLIGPDGQAINAPVASITPTVSDPGPATDLIPQDPFPFK